MRERRMKRDEIENQLTVDTIGLIPFAGPLHAHSKDEPIEERSRLFAQVHVRVFDLSNEKDLAAYREVWYKIYNGVALGTERLEFDRRSSRFLAFMRWVEPRKVESDTHRELIHELIGSKTPK